MTKYLLFASLTLVGCSQGDYHSLLPLSSELGSVHGYRVARVITHDHSPYSYDACDKRGPTAATLQGECFQHFQKSLCDNHIDLDFVSDHPNRMADFEMADLLLLRTGDETLLKAGKPVANRAHWCSDGFTPLVTVGFESKLLGLGLTEHLTTDPATRGPLYDTETNALRMQLDTQAEALVFIPHTESRSVDTIRTIDPDGIEIYNFHANLDPKIRRADLGLPPFETIPGILTYLIDPYRELNADFAFMSFLSVHPIYASKWDQLLGEGLKLVGIGGTDSHENIFSQTGSDGERLDAHRRIKRLMSNHVWTSSIEYDAIKQALKAGRSFLVFEGLGSPVSFDFSATINAGAAVTLGDDQVLTGTANFYVRLPTLHSSSPRGKEPPRFQIRLKRVQEGGPSSGQGETVAVSNQADLYFSTTQKGIYRAEIWIQPLHLREILTTFGQLAFQAYPWILSNSIYLR